MLLVAKYIGAEYIGAEYIGAEYHLLFHRYIPEKMNICPKEALKF